ncbi:hypothetical protein DL151_20155 [Salmonella enterica subsp. salamae]|nr:hypothetical protein [Salmonella enterica subsp. salamae]EDR0193544.1 hypothetical protein [Salmonella enterica subsp. houtenae]MJG40961.1 hypothetical protein [Salmonella enterica subsp. salamae]
MLNLFKYLISVFTFKTGNYKHQPEPLHAPLGLTWGLNIDEIKKEIEAISEITLDERTTSIIFNPPNKIFDFENFELTVDEKYGLIGVTMTEYFSISDFDLHGKGSYYDINKIISKKYGNPSSIKNPDNESEGNVSTNQNQFSQSEDFINFLKDRWSSFYSFESGGWISVDLKKCDQGNSFLKLEYISANAKKIIREQVDKEKEKMSEFL